LLHVVTSGQQRFDGTVGQQRAQREAQVGGVEDFATRGPDGLGQALSTKIGGVLQALPAAFGVLLEGLLEAGGGGHLAVVEGRGVLVAFPVQGCHDVFIQFGAFFQHGLGGLQAGIFESGQLCHLLKIGQVLHVEQHVLDGGFVGHFACLQKHIRKGHRERCPCCSRSLRSP